ncbi:MAG: hypothetical protein HN427_04635 [Flavobacteriales bacterium]|jgi:hypothetical protein|nr:hypothetical protein [Flavobacteriales bacterium]MBT7481651.1 hypothetical protein [Flavobacteriales bacterium]
MKKLLIILLCLPFIGFGQGWEVALGSSVDDLGVSGQQTSDGGYIITGFTRGFGNGNLYAIYLVKTDAFGIEQWYNTFRLSDSLTSQGYSVQQTSDGGYIITGNTTISNSTSPGGITKVAYLIKTDGNGIEQWRKNYVLGISYSGYEVCQTTDGGYIIAGLETGSTIIILIKTDSGGQVQWNQTFFGALNYSNFPISIQQTTDGGYITACASNTPFNAGLLIKTDNNGIEQWRQTLAGTVYSVQETNDGGYIVTGFITVNGEHNCWLIKTDISGIQQWAYNYGGRAAHSVRQTSEGGFIILGDSMISIGNNGNKDIYLIKTDVNGTEQWSKIYGGIGYEVANSVQQITDGGYILIGSTNSFGNGGYDVYLVKTDGNGNVTAEFTIPINSNRKLEKVVDILGRDINPEKNKPFIEIYNDGTVEKKIIIE